MATLRNSLFLLPLLSLLFTQIASHTPPETIEVHLTELGDTALRHELDRLKSKISSLESSIDERSRELSNKDESIRDLEAAIQEKSESLQSLENEIEYLQRKASVDGKEKMGSHSRATELEKQVDNLRKEIEMQNKKKDALDVRREVAERKIHELNQKIVDIQRINSEQKSKIQKTERSLQIAQEEIMKAKLRAVSVSRELTEVHGEWLPQWLAVHIYHFQSYMVSQWNEHGRPALDITVQKSREKIDQLQSWAEPQIRNVNEHVIPMMKDEWSKFINYLEPLLRSLLSTTIDFYDAAKNSLTPHLVKGRSLTYHYIREVKKFSEPYVNHVATVTKPHYETMQVALKPYTKKAIRTYRKLNKSARIYHQQIRGTLKSHELTKSLANMDLAWFLATAILSLPILVLFKLFSLIFSGMEKRHTSTSSHVNHTRRRVKRHHPDK